MAWASAVGSFTGILRSWIRAGSSVPRLKEEALVDMAAGLADRIDASLLVDGAPLLQPL